jgi:hypothetical protein
MGRMPTNRPVELAAGAACTEGRGQRTGMVLMLIKASHDVHPTWLDTHSSLRARYVSSIVTNRPHTR